MKEIGIGVIGTGFMGKAHSIAYSASASVFGTGLRPRLEIVCDLRWVVTLGECYIASFQVCVGAA